MPMFSPWDTLTLSWPLWAYVGSIGHSEPFVHSRPMLGSWDTLSLIGPLYTYVGGIGHSEPNLADVGLCQAHGTL